jgi:hypothetical protein
MGIFRQNALVVEQFDPGQGIVPSLEQVAVGTSLWVQPQLGAGDEIVLHLNLESNSLRATDPRTGLPEIGRRTVDSVLRVRDNETVLLAGLQLEDQTRETRSIPARRSFPAPSPRTAGEVRDATGDLRDPAHRDRRRSGPAWLEHS